MIYNIVASGLSHNENTIFILWQLLKEVISQNPHTVSEKWKNSVGHEEIA